MVGNNVLIKNLAYTGEFCNHAEWLSGNIIYFIRSFSVIILNSNQIVTDNMCDSLIRVDVVIYEIRNDDTKTVYSKSTTMQTRKMGKRQNITIYYTSCQHPPTKTDFVIHGTWVPTNIHQMIPNSYIYIYIYIYMCVCVCMISPHTTCLRCRRIVLRLCKVIPDSKVHGANMGPTWVLSAPGGPMLSPWTLLSGILPYSM